MQQFIHHILSGDTLLLSFDRCIYWQEQEALILGDLHLGKTGQLRKSAIAVPQAILKGYATLVKQSHLYKFEN